MEDTKGGKVGGWERMIEASRWMVLMPIAHYPLAAYFNTGYKARG